MMGQGLPSGESLAGVFQSMIDSIFSVGFTALPLPSLGRQVLGYPACAMKEGRKIILIQIVLVHISLSPFVPSQCDPALLPEPNHVMLNHLYALSIKVTTCLALEQFLSMWSEDPLCQDCLEVLTARAAFGVCRVLVRVLPRSCSP